MAAPRDTHTNLLNDETTIAGEGAAIGGVMPLSIILVVIAPFLVVIGLIATAAIKKRRN